MSRQCEMMQKEKDDLQQALSDREKEISSLLRLGEDRVVSCTYAHMHHTCSSIHTLYMYMYVSLSVIYGIYVCVTGQQIYNMAVYVHAKVRTCMHLT